jgi:hypothetical protein
VSEAGDEINTTGTVLGPYLDMPQDVSPALNAIAPDGVFRFDIPGRKPDLTQIYVADVTSLMGCCCVDLNMNGVCDPSELPPMCGSAPVQFLRWSVFGPGGLMSYAMPLMRSGVDAFEYPREYVWVLQEAIAPRFSYNEFIYNQYSPYFWKSWSLWYSQFLAKEQTK